jgi:hypothetical protein
LVTATIDPPPAALAEPCTAGPAIPEGDVGVLEALATWREREAAGAVCRDRHDRLVKAWPK